MEAIFPEDSLPAKWQAFVRINAAYGQGVDAVDALVSAYADEHGVSR